MIETLKVIHHRRSIRAYRMEQITDAELQAILEAALINWFLNFRYFMKELRFQS